MSQNTDPHAKNHNPHEKIEKNVGLMMVLITIAVSFGAAGIRRTRYTVPAALTADLVGFMAAAWSVRLFFGT